MAGGWFCRGQAGPACPPVSCLLPAQRRCPPCCGRPPTLPHCLPPTYADTTVNFRVTLTEGKMREALAAGLLDKFKLRAKISTGAW